MQKLKSRNLKLGLKSVLLASTAALAISAMPVMAQDSDTSSDSHTYTVESSTVTFKVDVGAIDVVDANMDELTIREIISGNIEGKVDAIAGLKAKRISIPELKVTYEVTTGVSNTSFVASYNNLVFEDIVDGKVTLSRAASLTGSGSFNQGKSGTPVPFEFEGFPVEYADFDIAGYLNVLGLTTPPNYEMRQVSGKSTMGPGTVTVGKVACEVKGSRSGNVNARAFKVPVLEIIEQANAIEAAQLKGEKLDPATLKPVFDFYADILFAFEAEQSVFDGLNCSGESDKGTFELSMGEISIGSMGGGIYPALSFNDFSFNMEGDDDVNIKFDNVTFKATDYGPTVDAYLAMPEMAEMSEEWMEENFRQFIPSFDGFAISGLSMDVPDPDSKGERVNVGVESLDFSFGNYQNGIPTDISISGAGINVDLPKQSKNDSIAPLLAMGIDRLNVGYDVSLHWDEENSLIELEKLMVTGEKLGTIDISGTLAGATSALFSSDIQAAMIGAMSLGVVELDIKADNQGFLDLALASAAAEQGAPAEAFQAQMSAMSNGIIVGMLGGTEQAISFGGAISSFIGGAATTLDINIKSKQETGVGLPQVMALQSDPTQLLNFVDIVSSAE